MTGEAFVSRWPWLASLVAAALAGLVGLVAPGAPVAATPPSGASSYVGSAVCATCHAAETRAWQASHHARAMLPATAEAVLGDFSGVGASAGGSHGRFFRDGDLFMVETEGRDGRIESVRVSHTLGWEPLQQYLVTLDDGRLQALPWAWDSRPREAGGQRWFHVYGDDPVPPGDPRHWTRGLQTWNHMCAECHVTRYDKGYDPAANRFVSTWSELGVGCEACHGGADGHVAWASAAARPEDPLKGFASAVAARPAVTWTPDPATGSPAARVTRPAGDEVDGCARCHARRSTLSLAWQPGRPLADTHQSALLLPGLFEDDGQMRDEVFNDQTFRQSLMFARGVSCSDCHDVHSGNLKAAGAQVCSQCHAAERFSTTAHSGHAPGPSTPDCIGCHMPARTYMQVDRRHDHSFRIPRPDVSASIGTPNACNDCHTGKSAAWAADAVERWHGPTRKGHQTFAAALHASRIGEPSARAMLQRLATDSAVPAIARATAVDALSGWPSRVTDEAQAAALADPDPLVRATALRSQEGLPAGLRWSRARASLSDPVRMVRIAAATLLADQRQEALSAPDREALASAVSEAEEALRLDLDRPDGRARLGLLRMRQGRPGEAEAEFRAGLALEPGDAALTVNLADLLRRTGREADGERELRDALKLHPDEGALHHALGLSLVRLRRVPEALEELRMAAAATPAQARYAYVYAVALRSAGRLDEADAVLRSALQGHPADADIVTALLQSALSRNDVPAAASLARRLVALRPDDREAARLLSRLDAR